jgi:hypothetical protein
VYALVLDVDKMPKRIIGGATETTDKEPLDQIAADAVTARLTELGLRCVVHTTHSHLPPLNVSLRVVIAISRPVPAASWEAFWSAAVAHLGVHVEPSCRNPDRFWYAPSHPPGAQTAWSRVFEGEPLDVDALLAAAEPPPDPKPKASTTGSTYTPREGDFDLVAFVAERHPGAKEYTNRGHRCWDIECPWEHEHTPGSGGARDTVTSIAPDGVLGFSCQHDHCKDRHWREFRKYHQPDWVPFNERDTTARTSRTPEPDHEDDDIPDEAYAPSGTDRDMADQEDFARDEDGKIHTTQANVVLAIAKLGASVRYDAFANRELVDGLPGFGPSLDDAALNRLRMRIDSTFSFRIGKEFFCDVVSDRARLHSFHPVRDYLGGLAWDGTTRRRTRADNHCTAQSPRLRSTRAEIGV